jgi:plasmid stability protein
MRRKQIYLDDASERALKRRAARTGRSEASLIREALQRYLANGDDHPGDDPLERLIGLVPDETGPDDVAEEHDHYLYGVPKEQA